MSVKCLNDLANQTDPEAGNPGPACGVPAEVFDSLEKALFEDGIKGAILETVNQKAGKALGSSVKGASQKVGFARSL